MAEVFTLSALVDSEITVSCNLFICITGVKKNKIYKNIKQHRNTLVEGSEKWTKLR